MHKFYYIKNRYGISTGQYTSVHYWLKKTYGKADRCENKKCLHKSTNFNWALKQGKKYEKNRKNFLLLCRVCHCIYDCRRDKLKACKRGHLYEGYNLINRTYRNGSKARVCRQCDRMRKKKYRDKKREILKSNQ